MGDLDKEILAQPEPTVDGWPLYSGLPQPEPVAWMYEFGTDNADAVNDVRWYKNVSLTKPHGMVRDVVPLYTAPPKKEWVGLNDDEIEDLWGEPIRLMYSGHYNAIRAIEAKLKEKNGD